MHTGSRGAKYEEYVTYATERINILEAEVGKISNRSCPARKTLKKMALCYRYRITKRKELVSNKVENAMYTKRVAVALCIIEDNVSAG